MSPAIRLFAIFAILVLCVAAISVDVSAQRRFGGGMGGGGGPRGDSEGAPAEGGPNPEIAGAFIPMRARLPQMEARGFLATGLKAVYPADADCLPIVSPFASPTRHDGSKRSPRFYQGLHGGSDIAAPDGTPLIAIADGTVVHKGEGENIGGIGLMLQHAPADTGLGVWLYTEYKHLREQSGLEIGSRVRMGDKVGEAGNTGTTGGRAYGEEGFYHLHWTAFVSDGPEYKAMRMFIPVGGRWIDPLAVFLRDPLNSKDIRELPGDRKRVRIAYRTTDGRTIPETARIVWPIACTPKG